MKAMAMVAHPDDCVIFAYSFIYNHPEYTWTVCYLTYNKSHKRAQEFMAFWNRRGVVVKFLGYPDEWNYTNNCPGDINEELASRDIQLIIADQDLILTHNEQGDYGHPHHILVHRASIEHPNRVFFAGPGQGNIKYSIDETAYSLDELPLHREIIANFHLTKHTNEYKL